LKGKNSVGTVPKSLYVRTRPGWPHVGSPGDRTPLCSLGSHASLSSQRGSVVLLSSRCSASRLRYSRRLTMDARAAGVSSTRSDGASPPPPQSPLPLAPPRLAMPSSTSVSLFLLHRSLHCHLSMMKPSDKRMTAAAERRDGTSCGRRRMEELEMRPVEVHIFPLLEPVWLELVGVVPARRVLLITHESTNNLVFVWPCQAPPARLVVSKKDGLKVQFQCCRCWNRPSDLLPINRRLFCRSTVGDEHR
jgi:hypothetical protein